MKNKSTILTEGWIRTNPNNSHLQLSICLGENNILADALSRSFEA